MRFTKKMVSLLTVVLLAINTFAPGIITLAATPETIAAWDYTAVPTAKEVPATSGSAATGAGLTNSMDTTPGYGSSGLILSNWDGGKDTKYWQIKLSTVGYENLTLSAKTRSSGTGPRDFKVIYSVNNGSNWSDVPNGTYSNTTTLAAINLLTLPADAANVSNLLVRFIMASNTSQRAGTSSKYPADEAVASGGTSNINNIVVSGTKSTSTQTVGSITATPDSGAVTIGSKVALNCETAGAAIMYSLDGGTVTQYDSNAQITLNKLPAVIKAYGTKSGMTDGTPVTFNYTQAKTASVTASPNGGSVNIGDKVTLSCATPNSSIKYSIDGGSSWNDYSSEINISKLPFTIKAYASSNGFQDSKTSDFNFTQKVSGDSNLYFGQLHSHTTNSDGIGTLDDAYSHAKDTAKLDFFAVTDHSNSFDNDTSCNMGDGSKSTKWNNGHAAADKYTDSNFVGIYAYEMTWSDGTGHINTFNTNGFESRNNTKLKSGSSGGLQNYYNILKNYPDSISQFNHPGNTFGDFYDFANYDPQIDKQISLIEVGNGEGKVRSSGYFPSYDDYTRALDKGWHLSPTNNQDNHKGLWGDANTARTVILADSLTRDKIYDAMKNMHTYATEDNDLRIKYTLNGNEMGTILTQKPQSVDIKVDLEDPDNEAIGKVSVISNGGKVVASKTLTTSKDSVEFKLSPDDSYYYIRVDEADKDIAVTAPVWISDVDKAGISKTEGSTTLPVKGQKFTVTSNLYNNESAAMNIESLEYSINGTVINSASALSAVASLGTSSYSFDYTPDKSGKYNIDVKLKANINGVEKIFTDVLQLNAADPAVVTKVVVDGSHYNDYVNGYYAGNMTNLISLANDENIDVVVQKGTLTDDVLKDTQLLILSPPAKKSGTDKNSGAAYVASPYTDTEIAAIKKYADNGGNIIVTGLADYNDSTDVNHTSYQQNRILAAIGATSRLNDDEVLDYDNNPNVPKPGVAGGTPYRAPMGTYNTASPYLQGVDAKNQSYSFYSGCSITLGKSADWLVKGTSTAYGCDSDNDKLGGSYASNPVKEIPADTGIGKGNVVGLATETLPGGGKLFVGGTVFYSNFEIKTQLDNSTQLQNSNYNITMNILDSIKKTQSVTPISDIRSGQMGNTYSAEGIVTAGTTSGNAFFDTIYIQDATGGINLYPVSGMDIKVGQKVKVTGTLDQYQGDKELRVTSASVTDTSINPITPAVMTTKDAMDSNNGGKLIKVQGKITKVDIVNNVVSAIYVKDDSGIEARLFIDGYIGYSDSSSAKLEDIAKVGNTISGIGLASADPDGNRLRVRDRSELSIVSNASQGGSQTTTTTTTTTAPSNVSNSSPASVLSAVQTAIASNNAVPTVDVSSSPVVSKDVFNAIKGQNKTITFTGNNITWTFNGKDISSAVTSDIDLSLKTVSSDLQAKELAKIKAVTGKDANVFCFSFNYEGALPGTATVKIFMGKAWANKTVNVCRYYSDKNTYEIVQNNLKVDADGYLTYTTNHCSDYFVTDNSQVTNLPQTGAIIDYNVVIDLGVLCALLGIALFIAGKKRNDDDNIAA